MKMKYSILWFDDTEDVFNSLNLKPLEEVIDSWGFIPSFQLVTNPQDFMAHEPFSNFDLIVVDYNLEEYEAHGEEFIKKIREHDVYTEIIFYSANPSGDLWKAVSENQLEGVFISNRNNVLTKIEKVANQSVKKIVDLENMRGILMAEVGDIDLLLNSIISQAFNNLTDEEKAKILNKFCERYVQQNKTALFKIESIQEIDEILGLCDSAKRWMLFRSIGKVHPHIKQMPFDDYQEMVLNPRNFLAHGMPEPIGESVYIFRYGGKEYQYDHNSGRDLRNHIKRFKSSFTSLNASLS